MFSCIRTHLCCRQNNAAATLSQLHGKLADYVWQCLAWRGLALASQHYVRGKDMTAFAAGESSRALLDVLRPRSAHMSLMSRVIIVLTDHAALEQAVQEGTPDEEDLFIARAVLQLLATSKPNVLNEKLDQAHKFLSSYNSIQTLPKTPLMNFIHFLLQVRHWKPVTIACQRVQVVSNCLLSACDHS